MVDAKKIGLNIAKRREELKLSQQRVAELADISREYISQIETGERKGVSLAKYMAICKILEIPIAVLVGEVSEEDWQLCQNILQAVKQKT